MRSAGMSDKEKLRGTSYTDLKTSGKERAKALKKILELESISKPFGVDVRTGKGTLKPLGKVLDELSRELGNHE
jgi:hypothetical protein